MILVTGASGLLGSALLNKLKYYTETIGVSRKSNVYLSDKTNSGDIIYGDFNNEQSAARILTWLKPEAIYHLGENPLVKNSNIETLSQNVNMLKNILKFRGHAKIIYSSSATVYGADYGENCYEYNSNLNPNSWYGLAKKKCEDILKFAQNYFILRFTAITGSKATHGLVPDLIKKLCSSASSIELYGVFPGATKPFLHILDAIHYLDRARLYSDDILNVSNPDLLTVYEVYEIARECLNAKPKEIIWNKDAVWSGDSNHVEINLTKLSKQFGLPVLTSKYAIIKTVADYKGGV